MKTLLAVALSLAVVGAACATAPKTQEQRNALLAEAELAVEAFKQQDATLKTFFEDAAGWAVLPTVGKGGAGIGGAYGKGVVFAGGEFLGYCDMTQASFGFQFGGQAYSQIVFFKSEDALSRFTAGNFEFSAQVSAVAATAGIAASTDYVNGMAVFTLAKGGLMYEATVAGQKFDYVAK